MSLESIWGPVGGAAGVAAFFLWLLKTGLDYGLKKELQEVKDQGSRQLLELNAALTRVARLEEELSKNREMSYSELWGHTDSLNLFGPTKSVACADLGLVLKDWYFTHGWLMTQEARDRYFLVQEALNFGALKSVKLQRPADEELYDAVEVRTVDSLRSIRQERPDVKPPAPREDYKYTELTSALQKWKSDVITSTDPRLSGENGWVLIQFLLSAFRTQIVNELGSREALEKGVTDSADAARVADSA